MNGPACGIVAGCTVRAETGTHVCMRIRVLNLAANIGSASARSSKPVPPPLDSSH